MARIDGGGGSVRPKTATPTPASTPKPASTPAAAAPHKSKESPKTSSAPVDTNNTSKTANVAQLDRDASTTASNPSASRDVTERQSATAANLTGAAASGGSSLFDRLIDDEKDSEDGVGVRLEPGQNASGPVNASGPANATGTAAEANSAISPVADPIKEEQRTDIEPPPALEAGAPIPPTPNFDDQKPASSKPLATGGTEETFLQEGVTYTRQTGADGTVRTSYEADGVDYSQTSYSDGRDSTTMSQDGDAGLHSRTIDTDASGTLTRDSSLSTQAVTDPKTGKTNQQTRQLTVGPDGVKTLTEDVYREDGGRSKVTRVQQADGRIAETYSYVGDQGTVDRTTNTAVDGTAETRTERNYTSDQPLESLVDAPPVPEHAKGVVPLPASERDKSRVREVEVVSTDAAGVSSVQYAEESYSQTSGAVELNGSTDIAAQSNNDTFSFGILPDNDGSSITQTITKVKTRDENGALIESTGASQTLTLAGDRHPDLGGGEVSVTRTDSWNQNGESSTNVAEKGFQEGDLFPNNYGDENSYGLFSANVEGRPVSAGYPAIDGSPFDHYNRKGGGEIKDWLGLGSDDGLDVGITVSRNAAGETTSEAVTYSTLDATGDGKTVTRSNSGGAVGWTYNELANDGQDYKRQTVFEGTDVSVYEEHKVTGPGQFTTLSETREGDALVASSNASRVEASEADLRKAVADGALTQPQVDRMITDGPPYFSEQFQEHAEPLKDDDGNLRKDDNGNIIQSGHDVTSSTFANSDGYAVSEHFRQNYNEGENWTDSRLSVVTDPSGQPPIDGSLVNRSRDPVSGVYTETERGKLQVTADGGLSYGGKEVGQFDFAGSTLATLLKDGSSIGTGDILGVISGAAEAGEGSNALRNFAGGHLSLTGDTGTLARLGKGIDIFGVATGVGDLVSGITGGDGRDIVEGLGDIAGGLNSLAAATSVLGGSTALGSRAAQFSSLTAGTATLGKALGAAGGVVSLGFGLYDVFTADSGWDKAAGGLAAASGAVAIGSVFFGPPGWVVGGLISGVLGIASIFVGGGDDNDTAGIDSRLQS